MGTIYLATLGQRPEAITVAFDALSERYQYSEIAILHTEPQFSGIADAYHNLKTVLAKDYSHLSARWHELTSQDGSPLLDIESQADANQYYQAVVDILTQYKRDGYALHLMVAGGRKAMSIYATLAAAVIFGPNDRVWTVLSPYHMLNPLGQFHIPTGSRHLVHLVQLPLLSARLLPSQLPQDVLSYLAQRNDLRSDFFARLSKAEKLVAEAFTHHPYATNDELAVMLSKSKRTIDNQFRSMYLKFTGFVEYPDQIGDKRAMLRDLLLGRY